MFFEESGFGCAVSNFEMSSKKIKKQYKIKRKKQAQRRAAVVV